MEWNVTVRHDGRFPGCAGPFVALGIPWSLETIRRSAVGNERLASGYHDAGRYRQRSAAVTAGARAPRALACPHCRRLRSRSLFFNEERTTCADTL